MCRVFSQSAAAKAYTFSAPNSPGTRMVIGVNMGVKNDQFKPSCGYHLPVIAWSNPQNSGDILEAKKRQTRFSQWPYF